VTPAATAPAASPAPAHPPFSALRGSAAWLLGFVVLFNPYLVPGSASSPRLSDLVGAGLWALLLVRLLTGRPVHLRVAGRLMVALLLILGWVLRDVVQRGAVADVFQVRWLLALSHGYFFWLLARDPVTRYALVIGLCWGTVGNLAVVAMQWSGLLDLTISLGFASPNFQRTWTPLAGAIEERPFGMWGHPNATSGVIALCVPLVLGLIDEGRLRTRWLWAAFGVVFLSSTMTLTRSGIVISAVVFAVWILGPGQTTRQRGARMLLIVLVGGAAALLGPPGGWERWTDGRTAANQGERLETTLVALSLAAEHPLGIGADYQTDLVRASGGLVAATHNAWMHLALVAGAPLAVLVMASILRHAAALVFRRSIEGWLAVSMMGILLFEEYFRVLVFQILALWLLATPAGLLRSLKLPIRRPAPGAAAGPGS
jgi:hypothetical protein